MATIALDETNFESTVTSDGIVLVDFWAEWCGPCKRFGPIYENASTKNDDIVFGKVDTEAAQNLSMQLEIQAIPTLMAFKDGKLLFRNAGALNAAQLDSLISQVREHDPAKADQQS